MTASGTKKAGIKLTGRRATAHAPTGTPRTNETARKKQATSAGSVRVSPALLVIMSSRACVFMVSSLLRVRRSAAPGPGHRGQEAPFGRTESAGRFALGLLPERVAGAD